MIAVFVKTVLCNTVLCNWVVRLAAVAAMTTASTARKTPTGMMMGAKVSVADRWIWIQIPVTLGNLVGSLLTHKPRKAALEPLSAPTRVPAE
jgi:formate transporter